MVKIWINQGGTSTEIGRITTDNLTDRQRWTAHVDPYFDSDIRSFNLESLKFWVKAGVHYREETFQRSFPGLLPQSVLQKMQTTKTWILADYSLDYQLFKDRFVKQGFDIATFDNTELIKGDSYINDFSKEIVTAFIVKDIRPINVRFH